MPITSIFVAQIRTYLKMKCIKETLEIFIIALICPKIKIQKAMKGISYQYYCFYQR